MKIPTNHMIKPSNIIILNLGYNQIGEVEARSIWNTSNTHTRKKKLINRQKNMTGGREE